MQTHNVTQGSAEWVELRTKYFTASEAPAMLGLSKYVTRDQLLRQKATGTVEEVDAAKQRLFDAGHEAEALARPIAEKIIGEDLFPVTGSVEIDGLPLLASFDGLTMLEDMSWENKLWNDAFAKQVADGIVPDTHWPQLEQQLLISGADRALFTVSDGTEEKTVSTWYESQPARRAQLIAGWKQFAEDLKNYAPAEPAREAVAAPQMALPAVSVQVAGSIAVTDNLKTFGEALAAYVERINQKPQTDDDFATLELQAKQLKQAEDALTAAEDNALGQAADIDTLRKTVAHYREIARQARLAAEKIVKAEKEARKTAIVRGGIDAFVAFCKDLAARFPAELPMVLPDVHVDFYGAAKGLKTIASIQNAVNTTLAQAKLDASALADRIATNLRWLAEQDRRATVDYRMLALKDHDDMKAVVNQRLADFKAEQERQLAAERERIAAEERARLEREKAAEQITDQATVSPNGASSTPTAVLTHPADAAAQNTAPAAVSAAPAAASVTDSGPLMNLGQINTRLGFTVTAGFLSSLGIEPRGTDKRAVLYSETDFRTACDRIAAHCLRVGGFTAKRAA